MSTRKQLAALLANDQVILSDAVVAQIQALADSLGDRIAAETPAKGSFIQIGMDWGTLEVGRLYALPAGEWRGGNQLYFADASKHMKANREQQFEFGGTPKDGHWVKRIR